MRPAEETVVRQCAPTLAGIKTGSLFPCPYDSRQQLLADIRRMNRVLVPRGLCLLPMRLGQGRALLYLYRPQALRRDLDDDLSCRLLRQAGYPTRWGCSSATRRRMCRGSSTTGPRTSSAPGCGRYTATSSGLSFCSTASAAAPSATAPCGRPATGWSSWQWPFDKPLAYFETYF